MGIWQGLGAAVWQGFGSRTLDRKDASGPYRHNCGDGDLQGLGAAVLAGVLAAAPLTKKKLLDHTFMFVGVGAAASAVAELIADAIARVTMR